MTKPREAALPISFRKRTPAFEERRARIVAAARKEFLSRGLVSSKTRQIAEAAGVKEAMLWTCFGSKEEMFLAAIFDPLEGKIEEVMAQLDLTGPADDAARHSAFLTVQQDILILMRDVVPLLGIALFSYPRLGREYYLNRLAPLFEHWAKVTKETMHGWPFRHGDPAVALMSAWGIHFGLVLEEVLLGKPLDVPATAEQVADLLYYGIDRVA